MPDYAAIKAADAALGIADLTEAAAALNAQVTTATVPLASIPVAAIHGVLMLASTADWLRVEARAALSFSAGFPGSPAASDAPIAAAKLAVLLAASQVTEIQPVKWSGFLAQLAQLVAAGDVSAASQAEIEALAVYAQPAWQPPVTAGDVQTARAIA